MPRTIADLREKLFDVLDKIRDGNIDHEDAKQAVGVAKVLIDSGRLELEAVATYGAQDSATGFIGIAPRRIEGPK